MEAGTYQAQYKPGAYATVHHIWMDKAYGFFFVDSNSNPEFCTWSLDGKSHMGRLYNVVLKEKA